MYTYIYKYQCIYSQTYADKTKLTLVGKNTGVGSDTDTLQVRQVQVSVWISKCRFRIRFWFGLGFLVFNGWELPRRLGARGRPRSKEPFSSP